MDTYVISASELPEKYIRFFYEQEHFKHKTISAKNNPVFRWTGLYSGLRIRLYETLRSIVIFIIPELRVLQKDNSIEFYLGTDILESRYCKRKGAFELAIPCHLSLKNKQSNSTWLSIICRPFDVPSDKRMLGIAFCALKFLHDKDHTMLTTEEHFETIPAHCSLSETICKVKSPIIKDVRDRINIAKRMTTANFHHNKSDVNSVDVFELAIQDVPNSSLARFNPLEIPSEEYHLLENRFYRWSQACSGLCIRLDDDILALELNQGLDSRLPLDVSEIAFFLGRQELPFQYQPERQCYLLEIPQGIELHTQCNFLEKQGWLTLLVKELKAPRDKRSLGIAINSISIYRRSHNLNAQQWSISDFVTIDAMVPRFIDVVQQIKCPLKPELREEKTYCATDADILRWASASATDRDLNKFMHWAKSNASQSLVSLMLYCENRFEAPVLDWLTTDPRFNYFNTQPDNVIELVEEINRLPYTSGHPRSSIIIPTLDEPLHILGCIRSILYSGALQSFEILIADDNSRPSTIRLLESLNHPAIRLIRHTENRGFLENVQKTVPFALGEILILLNNDTIVLPGWLDELTNSLTGDVGLVGSLLLFPNATIQEAGCVIFNDGSVHNHGQNEKINSSHLNYCRDVVYVSGASLAITRALWAQIGGFDERFKPAYFEDTDLAFKVREAGYRVIYQPLSVAVHFRGGSYGDDSNHLKRAYMQNNHKKFKGKWSHKIADLPSPRKHDNTRCRYLERPIALLLDANTPTPDKDSGSVDVIQIIHCFQSLGFHIVFAAENSRDAGRYTRNLQRTGVECLYSNEARQLSDVVDEFQGQPAFCMAFRYYIANQVVDNLRRRFPNIPLILQTVDLHYLRATRQSQTDPNPRLLEVAQQIKQDELDTISKCDATIVLANQERELLLTESVNTTLEHIPFARPSIAVDLISPFRQRQDLIFIGGFRHPPNVDGLLWFLQSIWPLLLEKGFAHRLLIVGSEIPETITNFASSKIKILGHVEDLSSILQQVKISVAPLRFGAGLKGKIATSLQFGLPCITTNVGAEGFDASRDIHLKIADQPEDFAQAILDVYFNEKSWETLSHHGMDLIEKNFSLAAMQLKLDILLGKLGVTTNTNNEHTYYE